MNLRQKSILIEGQIDFLVKNANEAEMKSKPYIPVDTNSVRENMCKELNVDYDEYIKYLNQQYRKAQ